MIIGLAARKVVTDANTHDKKLIIGLATQKRKKSNRFFDIKPELRTGCGEHGRYESDRGM